MPKGKVSHSNSLQELSESGQCQGKAYFDSQEKQQAKGYIGCNAGLFAAKTWLVAGSSFSTPFVDWLAAATSLMMSSNDLKPVADLSVRNWTSQSGQADRFGQ